MLDVLGVDVLAGVFSEDFVVSELEAALLLLDCAVLELMPLGERWSVA